MNFFHGLANSEEYRQQHAAKMAELNQKIEERYRLEAQKKANAKVNTAALLPLVKLAQSALDERTALERSKGHKVRVAPKVLSGAFEGKPAIIKLFENGDRNRMDIYYGGEGGDPMTNNEHGHVVVDLRRPEKPREWWLEGPKGQRQRAEF